MEDGPLEDNIGLGGADLAHYSLHLVESCLVKQGLWW